MQQVQSAPVMRSHVKPRNLVAAVVLSFVCSTGYGFVIPFMLSGVHTPTLHSMASWTLRDGGSVWFMAVLWFIGSLAYLLAGCATFLFVSRIKNRTVELCLLVAVSACVLVLSVASHDVPLWPRVVGAALPAFLAIRAVHELLGVTASAPFHVDDSEFTRKGRLESKEDRWDRHAFAWAVIAVGCISNIIPVLLFV